MYAFPPVGQGREVTLSTNLFINVLYVYIIKMFDTSQRITTTLLSHVCFTNKVALKELKDLFSALSGKNWRAARAKRLVVYT